MIVYYIEEDEGHLLGEDLQQPQYRAAARGNAFSFFHALGRHLQIFEQGVFRS